MQSSNLKIWLRHFGIMMLVLVIFPALLMVVLANIPSVMGLGVDFGTVYFGISFFLFGDWLGHFSGLFASLVKSKADIAAIFVCWTLVCVVIASSQLILAKLQAGRNAK